MAARSIYNPSLYGIFGIPFRRSLAVLPLLALTTSLSAATGRLHLVVRDSYTHYAVHAKILLEGPESLSMQTDESGDLKVALPAGNYQMEISAVGYRVMTTHYPVGPGKASSIGIMLDAVAPPPEERLFDSSLRSGFSLLHGYATNEQGQPVAGVHVRLQCQGGEATTNKRGYFQLSVPTPPDIARDLAGIDTLIAQKPGYKTIIHENFFIAGEDGGGFLLDMKKGAGVLKFDDTHVLLKTYFKEMRSRRQ